MRLGVFCVFIGCALSAAGVPAESVQDLISRLTPGQKAMWDDASKAFEAQQYGAALASYKQLLGQLPGDPVLSKFAAEAALDTDENPFALSVLKPVANDPNDWQATSLMARACAQTGDSACRDSNMAHLLDLHRQGIAPPNMRQYIAERLKVGDKTLTIAPSLEPLGPYKIQDTGRVADQSGAIFLRLTIESSDGDQPMFAQAHPIEAAAGERAFSLDGYLETGRNSSGQRTQTHFTYKMLVGQPGYEQVRQLFIDVISGKVTAISSRTGLIVQ